MAGTREDLLRELQWGVEHNAGIHYSQHRPMPLGCPLRVPLYVDCSSWLTVSCHCAGLPDPNGLGFNGQGYTGTMLSHLPHISRGDALPGDFGVYGAAPGEHVVALAEPGSRADPEVYSHGSEIGPLRLRLSAESSVHAGKSLTWLRIPVQEVEDVTKDEVQAEIVDALQAHEDGVQLRLQGKPRPPVGRGYGVRGWDEADRYVKAFSQAASGSGLSEAQVKAIISATKLDPPS